MANNETFSIIIKCSHDAVTNTNQLQVIRTDTGEIVHLQNATFVARVSIDRDVSLLRCQIRHLTSEHETYIQSSTKLEAFILACLLQDDTPPSEGTAPASQG